MRYFQVIPNCMRQDLSGPCGLMPNRHNRPNCLIQNGFAYFQGVKQFGPVISTNSLSNKCRQVTWSKSPLVGNLERLLASGTPFVYWRLIWCLVEKGLSANRMTKCQAGNEVHFIRAYKTVHA